MNQSAMLKGAVILALAGALYALLPLGELSSWMQPDRMEHWLEEAGVLAPLFFMLVMALFFLLPRWIERRNPFGLARHFRHTKDAP